MRSIKNQFGHMSKNETLDKCEICDKVRSKHTQEEANNCKRALANSV